MVFTPIAQRQGLVTVAGVDGYFATKSGGSISSGGTKVYDGGALTPAVIASPPESEDITVSRAYDIQRDAAIVARLRQQVGKFRTTLSVQPTDTDMVASGPAFVYPDALMTGISSPDIDSGSGDAQVFELTFSIGSWV
jgi:ribosomal protein S24E